MPATDALHVRTLVAEQLQGQRFRSIIDAFVSDDAQRRMHGYQRHTGGMPGDGGKPIQEAFAGHVSAYRAEAFANAMSIAETYYLSPEMHDICQDASQAEDFPEDETILREDPPSEAGFMYLPARFRIVELRGRLMVAHAVLWINNRVWWLCDRRDPEDEMNAELNAAFGQEGMPRYDIMAVAGFTWGEPMPKVLTFEKGVLPTSAKVEFREVPNKVGGSSRMMFTDALVHPGMSEPTSQVSPDLRFLLTVWRMMQQTITDVRDEWPDNKAVRRYADRAGIKNQQIHVIQLRRRESHPTGSGAPLSVRFVVRGHWRRIWCGPAEARYQRAIWIHPHLKGPEGAPLIHREKINALVR